MNRIRAGGSIFMLNKHSPIYRVFAIVLAYALFGTAIFVPIASSKPINYLLLWIALSVFLTALIATIVATEVIMAKRRKKNKDERDS